MKVVLVNVDRPRQQIVLECLPAMIGRDESSDVCLTDSWIGHFQCILDQDGGLLRVLDLGTRTGTFVNGLRIKRADLLPGDRLTVGKTDFLVQYECAARRPPLAMELATSRR